MIKKFIVIIPNELEVNLPIYVKECRNFHEDKIRDFINEAGIEIDCVHKLNTVELSFKLTKLGYLVILGIVEESNRDLIVFVPDKVSDRQFKYFIDREKGLRFNYEVMAYISTEKINWQMLDSTTTDKLVIDELISILKKRVVEKKKVLKKNLENEKKT